MKSLTSTLALIGSVALAGSSAHAVVIGFDSPDYSDGPLSDNAEWSDSNGGWSVADTGTDGVAVSNPSASSGSTASFNGFTDANTGIDVDDASGIHWGQFEVTINATSGTAQLATIDFGRNGNLFRVVEFDVYEDGDADLRWNIGNVPGPQGTALLAGLFSQGVPAMIKLEIDYDNLLVRLYKDNDLIDVPGDADDWIPFADQRGTGNVPVGGVSLIKRGGGETSSVSIDDLGLGTGVAPVPEPASLALLGLGGLLLVRRR